jgi:hypothetical protein
MGTLLTSNAAARTSTRSTGLPGAYVLLLRMLQGDCIKTGSDAMGPTLLLQDAALDVDLTANSSPGPGRHKQYSS